MNEEQAARLGQFVRDRREELQLSTRGLEERSGVAQTTIVRIENGAFTSPAPDKLARLAEALNLALADLYAMAEYAVPEQLPNPGPYLRAKYRDLPPKELDALSAEVSKVLQRHGLSLSSGPAPGEDEQPEASPAHH